MFFHNPNIRPAWTKAWDEKEVALRMRYQGCQQRLSEHCKSLPPLEVGDHVSLQNQTGTKPNKWDRTGRIIEVRDFDKYIVKVDGSGRLTLRNRRFLKKLYVDHGLYDTHKITQSHVIEEVSVHPPPLCEVEPPTPRRVTNSPVPHPVTMSPPVMTASKSPPIYALSDSQDIRSPMEESHVSNTAATTSHKTATPATDATPRVPTCIKYSAQQQLFPSKELPDRVPRNRKQLLLYDADKGCYVPPDIGKERSSESP